MIVDDFDLFRTAFRPHKTNTPLFVDANAVLAGATALRAISITQDVMHYRDAVRALDNAVHPE